MLLKLLFINAVEPGSLPPEIESGLDQMIRKYLKNVAKEHYDARVIIIDKKRHELTLDVPMHQASRRISNLQDMIHEMNRRYIEAAGPLSQIRPTAKMNVEEPTEIFADSATCTIRLSSTSICKDDMDWMEFLQPESVEQDNLEIARW
jgi:hypothetical protein